MTERKLDRLPSFDERSRRFAIGNLPAKPLRSQTWPIHPLLDQGSDGACVGFGHSYNLAATPHPRAGFATYDNAMKLYHEAQRVDEWDGEDYDGTSVLAGAKVLTTWGYYTSYHWALTIEEVMMGLQHGTLVFGIPWKESMFTPRPSGLLEIDGDDVGGHCICARGLLLKPRLRGEHNVGPVLRLRQSWGNWGVGGDCFVKIDEFWDKLVKDMRGEAMLAVKL